MGCSQSATKASVLKTQEGQAATPEKLFQIKFNSVSPEKKDTDQVKELLQLAVEGNKEKTKQICSLFKISSISKIMGLDLEATLLSNVVYTSDWNPLHLAIYHQRLELVKFYLEELRVNPRFSLLSPPSLNDNDCSPSQQEQMMLNDSDQFPTTQALCFPLVLAINNQDEAMLNYLLNEFSQDGVIIAYPLWNSGMLFYILNGAVFENWMMGVSIILKGNLAQHLYLNMDYYQRLDFIGGKLGQLIPTLNFEMKWKFLEILAEFPYAGMSIGFICSDKDTELSMLEKCLMNISEEDVELLYIYDDESILELTQKLKKKGVETNLIKKVFTPKNEIKTKDQLKLNYFEFIDHCISGNVLEAKFFLKSHQSQSVNYYYGLKKLLKLGYRPEPANSKYFSPMTFAVFYNRQNMIELMIKRDLINGFSSLKEPPGAFVDDDDDDDEEFENDEQGNYKDVDEQELGVSNDSWFQNEELETFALQILMSQQNYQLMKALIDSYFPHMWCFSHFKFLIEQTLYRGDFESLKFLLSLKTLKESYEVLEKKWQEFQIEKIIKKWLIIVEAEKDAVRKENKIKIGQALISQLQLEPFQDAGFIVLKKYEESILQIENQVSS